MFLSHKNDIINLYVFIDELVLPVQKPFGGRPQLMKDSELITFLIWNTLVLHQKTLKDIHTSLCIYHSEDFPHIPKYSAFVDMCHRLLPQMIQLLSDFLDQESKIRIVDSTMIPVCKLCRSTHHKTVKSIAEYGKNHQGWHYGFKLHASVSLSGKLSQIYFTPASFYDAQALPHILNKYAVLVVGDGTYNASVMRKIIWERYECHIVAPPHPKQNKKLISEWQLKFLHMRPKIESVFDYLKEHLNLVTSFPRSIKGYFFHYVKVLLSYAMMG